MPRLRLRALNVTPSNFGLGPEDEIPPVLGVLMELRFDEDVATVVSLLDCTTSLYYSNGGGVIGAGEHDFVVEQTLEFLAAGNYFSERMTPTTDFPLPEPGRVRFYVVTASGVLTAEADEEELSNNRDPLSPLFFQGHEVISVIRRFFEGNESLGEREM